VFGYARFIVALLRSWAKFLARWSQMNCHGIQHSCPSNVASSISLPVNARRRHAQSSAGRYEWKPEGAYLGAAR
jgi:hypothetical protein